MDPSKRKDVRFSSPSLIECPFCGRVDFTSVAVLERHIERLHPSPDDVTAPPMNYDRPITSSSGNTRPIRCPICEFVGKTEHDVNNHVQTEHFEDEERDFSSTNERGATASSSFSRGNDDDDGRRRLFDCPICAFAAKSADEVNTHVETQHFDNDDDDDRGLQEAVVRSTSSTSLSSASVAATGASRRKGNNASRGASNVATNGDQVTSGLMDLLRGTTSAAATAAAASVAPSASHPLLRLCSNVDHFATMNFDRGWGCGYRNIQMSLSSLLRDPLFSFVFDRKEFVDSVGRIPNIAALQNLVERAWSLGFDEQGCAQLGGRLRSTMTWIGATELVALFSSFNIRTKLFDFHHPTGDHRGKHPALFQFVKDYFQRDASFSGGRQNGRSNVAICEHPLYLQHQGHSRTIVGVEDRGAEDQFLLIFDPGNSLHEFQQQQQQLQPRHLTSLALLEAVRVPWRSLQHPQYQIVMIEGIFDSPEDQNRAKQIRSSRIP